MGISTAPEVLERIKDTARILAHGRVEASWIAHRRVWGGAGVRGRRLPGSSELGFGPCVGGLSVDACVRWTRVILHSVVCISNLLKTGPPCQLSARWGLRLLLQG